MKNANPQSMFFQQAGGAGAASAASFMDQSYFKFVPPAFTSPQHQQQLQLQHQQSMQQKPPQPQQQKPKMLGTVSHSTLTTGNALAAMSSTATLNSIHVSGHGMQSMAALDDFNLTTPLDAKSEAPDTMLQANQTKSIVTKKILEKHFSNFLKTN